MSKYEGVNFLAVSAAALLVFFPTSLDAQDTIFPALIGKWRHLPTGNFIEIRKNGDVVLDSKKILRVGNTIEGGGNFAFEGTAPGGDAWRCVYYVTVLSNGQSLNWRLIGSGSRQGCPEGLFERATRNTKRPIS